MRKDDAHFKFRESIAEERSIFIFFRFSISSISFWNTNTRLANHLWVLNWKTRFQKLYVLRAIMFGLFAFTFALVCITLVSRIMRTHLLPTCATTSFLSSKSFIQVKSPTFEGVGQAYRLASNSKSYIHNCILFSLETRITHYQVFINSMSSLSVFDLFIVFMCVYCDGGCLVHLLKK